MQSLSHIVNHSVSSVVSDDSSLISALSSCVPIFQATISSKNLGGIVLKDVHKTASSFLGDKVQSFSRKDERRLSFEALFILMLFNSPNLSHLRWPSVERLLESYPQFSILDDAEQTNLLKFRNVMVCALMIIPPKNRMEYLVDVVTRIVEGHTQKHYVNGSGAKPAARNRFAIYHMEGDTPRLSRARFTVAKKRNSNNDTAPSKKRVRKLIVETPAPLSIVLPTTLTAAAAAVVPETPIENKETQGFSPIEWTEDDHDLMALLSMDDFLDFEENHCSMDSPKLSISNCASPTCVSLCWDEEIDNTMNPLSPLDNIDWTHFMDQ